MLKQVPAGFKWLWVSALVILVDVLTKEWALKNIALGQSVHIFPGFNLTLAFNTGSAFSFLADQGGWQKYFFVALTFLIIIFILFLLAKNKKKSWFKSIALALIIGGAIGNLIDRLTIGAVIDFVDLYYQYSHWPTFNIADSAICLGVVMWAIDLLRKG